jgi:hypothetical protein
MTDKEILIQSVEKYAADTVGKLFGITSLPAQALIKYAVRNAADKYGQVIDLFQDKNGVINIDLLTNALKAEIKNRGGFTFMNVKFTEGDVEELSSIINKLKSSASI